MSDVSLSSPPPSGHDQSRVSGALLLAHVIPLGAFFTGVTLFDWIVCGSLYFFRLFWVTGGYHRYFAHRTYKTSRIFQFIIAFLAQTSAQKGALWWAGHHRQHHKTSDTPDDPHSARHRGFWYAHIGWITKPCHKPTDHRMVRDHARYPELVWLNKYHLIPPVILAIGVAAAGGIVNGGSIGMMFGPAGLSTLFIGFFLSTLLLYHGTFSVNSVAHKFGRQRYQSDDDSRNSFLLALITLGEGWHNNHHYYEASTRQGFFWWEIDITYYGLRLLAMLGLIWDLREVPDHIKYSRNRKEARAMARDQRRTKAAEVTQADRLDPDAQHQ